MFNQLSYAPHANFLFYIAWATVKELVHERNIELKYYWALIMGPFKFNSSLTGCVIGPCRELTIYNSLLNYYLPIAQLALFVAINRRPKKKMVLATPILLLTKKKKTIYYTNILQVKSSSVIMFYFQKV